MLGYDEILKEISDEAKSLSRMSALQYEEQNILAAERFSHMAVAVWATYYRITDRNRRREVLGY